LKETYRHVSDKAVIVEGVIRGTHKGSFLGIAATDRQIEIPQCAVFFFDEEGKLAGERVYFDATLILQQLGLLPTPPEA